MTKEEISKIFHDMKSPLVTMSGYMQLLVEDLKEAGVEIDYVDILMDSVHRVEDAINEGRETIEARVIR